MTPSPCNPVPPLPTSTRPSIRGRRRRVSTISTTAITQSEAEPEPVDASTEPTPPSSIAVDDSTPEPEPELEQADDNGETDEAPEEPLPARPSSATPIGIERPTSDDLPERELDPELMAAAMAELDAELSRRPDRDGAA